MNKREELLHAVAQLMSKRTPTLVMGGTPAEYTYRIRVSYNNCVFIDVTTDLRTMGPSELRIKTQSKYASDDMTETVYNVTNKKLMEKEICREVIRLAREKDEREKKAHKLAFEQKENEEITVAINNVKDLM